MVREFHSVLDRENVMILLLTLVTEEASEWIVYVFLVPFCLLCEFLPHK